MRAVLLGFGGWVSDPVFGHTSILITSTDSSEYLLLDAGEGVYKSMCECGYCSITKLKTVVLTHYHGDHILGLPTLVQLAKVAGTTIRVLGLEDTLEHALEMLATVGVSNYEGFVKPIHVEPGDRVSVGSLSVVFGESEHTVPGIAVRVEETESGKCLVYSGDTSFSEKLIELAKGCSVLVHEASFDDSESLTARSLGHSTISDCLKTASLAGNKFVLPVHFGPKAPRLRLCEPSSGVTVIFPSRCLQLEI
jgi:ribonuclease Z